jgi:type IV secretion system protein VirB1
VIDLPALIERCAPEVGPRTIAAIVRVESRGYPWALNVNGADRLARQPANRDEAARWAQWLVDRGYNVDLGLMQVNSTNLRSLGLSVRDALDPCTNLRAGSILLRRFYKGALATHGASDQALYAALSAYNTGNFTRGFANGYVGKVTGAAPPLVPRATSPHAAPAAASAPLALDEATRRAIEAGTSIEGR